MDKRRAAIGFVVPALVLAACWRMESAPPPMAIPGAVDALRIAPEGAWLALAGPALAPWEARMLNVAEAMAPEDGGAAARYGARIGRIAGRFGAANAESLTTLAHGLDLDPNAPFGLYLGEPDEEGAAPPAAVAMHMLDAAAAESAVRNALFGDRIAEAAAGDEAGMALWRLDENGPAYFVHAPWIVFGTEANLVAGAAARIADPAGIAYGTADCPAESADELAALVRMDRLGALAPLLGPAFSPGGGDAGEPSALETFAARYAPPPGAPAVVTLRWDDAGAELLYRIDGANHPALPQGGSSEGLTLAPMLPPASEAFAGVRFGETDLAAFSRMWMGLLPGAVRDDPLYKMAELQLQQALAALHDELAVAMLGVSSDQPALMALATLRDPEAAQQLFGAFSPLFTAVDDHEGTPIYGLPEALGFPLSYAAQGGRLVLGPNATMVKGALMQWDSGEASPLFASLEPPLDPAAPHTFAALLPQKLLREVILPAARDAVPETAYGRIDALLGQFAEVRILRGVEGSWRRTRIALPAAPFAETTDYDSLTVEGASRAEGG